MVSRGLGRRNEDLVKKKMEFAFFFFAICKMWDFAFRMAAAIRLEETGFYDLGNHPPTVLNEVWEFEISG